MSGIKPDGDRVELRLPAWFSTSLIGAFVLITISLFKLSWTIGVMHADLEHLKRAVFGSR